MKFCRNQQRTFAVLTWVAACIGVAVKPSSAAVEVIDNFDGQSLVADWWTSDLESPHVYALDFQNAEHAHSHAHALKVEFNKAYDRNVYSAFGASGFFNLMNFDYMTFRVLNNGNSLNFRLRIEDRYGAGWESNWGDQKTRVETLDEDWECIVFDLNRAYAGEVNLSEITQIIFMVEPGDTAADGQFWIDDIRLHRAANGAPIESFEADYRGWKLGGPFSVQHVADEKPSRKGRETFGQYCLKLTWREKKADYSFIVYETQHAIAHAPSGRIGALADFTRHGNRRISVWVRSETEEELPILLKLNELDLGTQHYTGKGAWEKLTWPYAGKKEARNVTHVYLFPYPHMEDSSGAVYFDDLDIEGGQTPSLPSAPAKLKSSNIIAGKFYIQWEPVAGAKSYEIQEAGDPSFIDATSYFETRTVFDVRKHPRVRPGAYYYRVRSNIPSEGNDNFGSFSKAIPAGKSRRYGRVTP